MTKTAYHEFYDYLRNHPPIKMQGSWLISTHESVKYILGNPELFRSNRIDLLFEKVEMNPKIAFAKKALTDWILHKDTANPQLKSKLATMIYGYFQNSLKDALAEKLQDIFESISDNDIEFRREVAIPVVTHLFMDILNIPKVDIVSQENKIFWHMQNIANLITVLTLTNEEAESFADSLLYVAKLGENYDGLDDNFSDEEFLEEFDIETAQKGAIFHAFMHDTVNLLCNVYYVMLENREKVDLENIVQAVAEAIRLEPPVQALVRTANQEIVIEGQQIKKDEMLTLFIASANRDEKGHQEEDLDVFRPGRKFEQFNFGYGLHACLGQHLARFVAQELMKYAFEKRNDEVKEVVWDNSIRTYRNMHHLLITSRSEVHA